MKTSRILALFPALVIGISALADADTFTFSGECEIAGTTIGSCSNQRLSPVGSVV